MFALGVALVELFGSIQLGRMVHSVFVAGGEYKPRPWREDAALLLNYNNINHKNSNKSKNDEYNRSSSWTSLKNSQGSMRSSKKLRTKQLRMAGTNDDYDYTAMFLQNGHSPNFKIPFLFQRYFRALYALSFTATPDYGLLRNILTGLKTLKY